jgi:hypothetical protein
MWTVGYCQQRVETLVTNEYNISSVTAIAAIWSTLGFKLFTAKTDATIAAFSTSDKDSRPVN